MEIASPQQVGYYVDREFDCKTALRPIVAEAIQQEHEAFLDLDRIVDRVAAQAQAAGWTHRDVQTAAAALVHERRDHPLAVVKVPPDEPHR